MTPQPGRRREFTRARTIANRENFAQFAGMRTKLPPVLLLAAIGSSAPGCGPIAFTDTINYGEAKPKPESKPDKPESPKVAVVPSRAKLVGDRIIITEKIQFEYDSHVILPESHALLDDVVKVMQDNRNIKKVDIVGYTSSEGSKKHNEELSKNRAAEVMKYLVEHGVDAARLTSQGKGPADPIADNATEEGKVANRRVEFHVKETGDGKGEGQAPSTTGARARPGGN
jgi:outer membrane protein OmpA-like peptidoglycan-associated protein